jgi:DnaJ-domain-containing protein 1
MLQHVSGTSVQEIDKLIDELQILREMLQKEAARVQHEIVGYAVLIQNARRSMRTISKSLTFLKNDRDDTPRISAWTFDAWIGELRFGAIQLRSGGSECGWPDFA